MKAAMEHCKTGERLKDYDVDTKKSTLELLVEDYGWDVLWKCRVCGKFWEASYEGRYAEREYLTCLEGEEVRLRWPEVIRGKQK